MSEPDISILKNITGQFELNIGDPNGYSPLSLAFIGDSVFDVVVKTVVVGRGNAPVKVLHKRASDIVKASAQADMLDLIYEELTEEEQNIYRRGRNSKPYTKAKNASYGAYLKATGFEALIGYLYLNGRTERLVKLIKLGMDAI
ncbi:MAG: ribonuclease III [Lachnospiraceae bacterium]|nr:ribonuclease III [Lachnospiraceae bacterium]